MEAEFVIAKITALTKELRGACKHRRIALTRWLPREKGWRSLLIGTDKPYREHLMIYAVNSIAT